MRGWTGCPISLKQRRDEKAFCLDSGPAVQCKSLWPCSEVDSAGSVSLMLLHKATWAGHVQQALSAKSEEKGPQHFYTCEIVSALDGEGLETFRSTHMMTPVAL